MLQPGSVPADPPGTPCQDARDRWTSSTSSFALRLDPNPSGPTAGSLKYLAFFRGKSAENHLIWWKNMTKPWLPASSSHLINPFYPGSLTLAPIHPSPVACALCPGGRLQTGHPKPRNHLATMVPEMGRSWGNIYSLCNYAQMSPLLVVASIYIITSYYIPFPKHYTRWLLQSSF